MAEKVTVRIWQGRKRSFYWLYTTPKLSSSQHQYAAPKLSRRAGRAGRAGRRAAENMVE